MFPSLFVCVLSVVVAAAILSVVMVTARSASVRLFRSVTVDIWSVGCNMAELLDGKALFPGTDHILFDCAVKWKEIMRVS